MHRLFVLPALLHALSVRRLAYVFVLGALGSVLQLGHPALWNIDSALQDGVLSLRTPESYLGGQADTSRDPRSFITIVAIDDRTLAELGAYNGGYPRAYHAQVIENLLGAPPRVIAFDLGFFEPTADDDELAVAIDHAHSLPVPTTVILSAAGLQAIDTLSPDGELSFERSLLPVPELAQRSQIALANVVPDSHGTIRGVPLLSTEGGVERPSLGLAAVASYLRRPRFVDGRVPGRLQLAGRSIPVDQDGFMRINFFGPPSSPDGSNSTFRVVSFVDVLRGRVDPSVWKGGLVFVGSLGATGLADDYWTPTSERGRKMAGVEIHANAAATLFSTNFLQTPPPVTQVALILGVGLAVAVLAGSLDLMLAAALGPLLMALVALAALLALYVFGWLVPVTTPSLVGFGALLCEVVPRFVAERRQAKAARAELAADRLRDRVTGLANRAHLLSQMHEMRGQRFALLVLDLDRFKDFNDSYGRGVGDRLLQTLGERLATALAGSGARVARLDGDEFAIMVPDVGSRAAAEMCGTLLQRFEEPISLDNQSLAVTASIGIALYPRHGADPETLLRHADAALHSAKQARCAHAEYQPGLEHHTVERLAMVAALRQAIADGELRLYYQPKVDCLTGAVRGVEALVRWQSPRMGLIAPDRFVPLAEQTGLIGSLTQWVLEAAVRQAHVWTVAGVPLRIAVNLSTWDLQEPGLAGRLFELLERYRVSPELLSLEITETAVLADPSRAMQVLNELAVRGVHAALDDFGTGYSSLTYVRQLLLHELKIDASFVRGLTQAERDRAIVCSTIDLGHRLGLSVVAEGVEDRATLELLGELGCDQAQGYYVGRPMPAEDVVDWVRIRQDLESAGVDPGTAVGNVAA